MIKVGTPPNYEEIKKFFRLTGDECFAYYPDIYAPADAIGKARMAHLEVNLRQQQEYGVKKWWFRYLIDPYFRASQEIEGYQAEYAAGMKVIKDRNDKARFLDRLATELCGENYGKALSYDEAMNAIREKEPIRFKV